MHSQRIPYEILLRCKKRRNLPHAACIIAGMALADAIGIGCYLLKHKKETL